MSVGTVLWTTCLEGEDEDDRRVSKKWKLTKEAEEGTPSKSSNSALQLRDKTVHNLQKTGTVQFSDGIGPKRVGRS